MFGLMTWLAAIGFAYAGEMEKKPSPSRIVKRELDANGYDENGFDSRGIHMFAPNSRWMQAHEKQYERMIDETPGVYHSMHPADIYRAFKKQGYKF